MSPSFYCEFDRTCLVDAWNHPRVPDYRSVFHQDRDRILFTPSFRRLQAKTQVFQTGEYDFYRTRLTHSLEVANIAKSLSAWLRQAQPQVQVDSDLLEAICLAHDIGHPPFGHSGERVLHGLMENYGGFEGNAQTLRILTRIIYSNKEGRGGLSPSRALLDGVLKYKRLFRDRGTETHHFLYDDQAYILEFCFGTADLGPLPNQTKSLECQIMDLADDIAYSCFDFVDGTQARFITTDKLGAWAESHAADLTETTRATLVALREMIRENRVVPRLNRVVGELIQSARLIPADSAFAALTARHRYALEISGPAQEKITLLKTLGKELVFGSSALRQIEYKGRRIITALARAFFEHYVESKTPLGKIQTLLPTDAHRLIVREEDAAQRARLVCDYLSGMTDSYALRSYKRLFESDFGSISELI